MPIHGIDHVEVYVGNAAQAAFYFVHAFGFTETAYAGLETGRRDRVSHVLEQGRIRLVLTGTLMGNDDIAAIRYVCDQGELSELPPLPAEDPHCGEGDPRLPPRPTLPPDPADANCILKATRVTPPEGFVLDEPVDPAEAAAALDSPRINGALMSCPVVKLVTDGDKNAFLSANIKLELRNSTALIESP